MKILITGCNGFIGKNLTDAFKKEHDIIGLGRAEISRADVRKYISCDIADRQRLSECIQKYSGSIDIVIHAAAEISDDVEKLYNTNCLGTQNIADFAKTAGASCFVYISSVPVIGIPQYVPITEKHPVKPATVYHYTKYFGEQIVQGLGACGIRHGCLRIPSPVGYGMPDNKIFSVFVKRCLENQPLQIYGNGMRVQNYLDVRDLTCAVDRFIESDANGVYNIAGNSISDMELAELCKEQLRSRSDISLLNNKTDSDSQRWIISPDAAGADFGYKPQISIEDSILSVAGQL